MRVEMTNGMKLFILTVVLFLYLLFGAVVFHFLESTHEKETRCALHGHRNRILWNHSCLDEEALDRFVDTVIRARDAGITLHHNKSSATNWDFSSAFFFSGTVVTTIGYGKISPRTFSGQLMCMVYAALGIPLTAWLLASVGASYQASFQRYVSKAERALRNVVSHARARQVILWFLVVSTSYTAFLILPSLIFTYLEGWSFHVAHYYSFITLSTIGFGDYLATVNGSSVEHWVYDIVVTIWNILGLAYLATLISVIRQGEMKTAKSIRKFHAKIVKKRKVYKGGKALKEGKDTDNDQIDSKDETTQSKILSKKNNNGIEARSKRSVVVEVPVMVPCFIKTGNSLKDAENGQIETQIVGSDSEQGNDTFDEVDDIITVEGNIVEEDNNMCIMLSCESENDVGTAEEAIQAALDRESVSTRTDLPHRSFSVQHHWQSCKMQRTQATQT